MSSRRDQPGTAGTTTWPRRILACPLPLALALAGWAWALAQRSSFPSPIAVHWALGGTPDGSGSFALVVTVSVVGIVLSLGLVALLARGAWHRPAALRSAAALESFFVLLLTGVVVGTAAANRGKPVWVAATLPHGWFAATVLVPVAVAFLVWWIWGRPALEIKPVSRAATTLAPDERAVWVGRCSARWAVIGASVGCCAFVAVAALAWLGAGHTATVLLIPIGVVTLSTLAFTHVTVTVDRRGLRIRYGVLELPLTHIPLERVGWAEATDLEPRQWGGWGFRIAVTRGSSVVLRRGPAIVVHRLHGAPFAVTVDDAPAGAALLEGLRQRKAQAGGNAGAA